MQWRRQQQRNGLNEGHELSPTMSIPRRATAAHKARLRTGKHEWESGRCGASPPGGRKLAPLLLSKYVQEAVRWWRTATSLCSRKRLYNIVPGTQPPRRRATRWRHHKGEDREDDQAFDKEDAGLAEPRGGPVLSFGRSPAKNCGGLGLSETMSKSIFGPNLIIFWHLE